MRRSWFIKCRLRNEKGPKRREGGAQLERIQEDGMKGIKAAWLWAIFLLLCTPALAEMKDKKFTPEEIKKMSETKAVIETKFGNIELKFFPEAAPGHVSNFLELAKKGFYDGTTFHRIIPGFMIQGGDPNTKSPDRSQHGMGGPGYTIKAEFSEKPHKKGILSMARAQDPNSAGSQFFICVAKASSLDGKYSVFGEVALGIEVVDQIVSQPRDKKDNPNDRIEMKVKVVEKQ
jgi:cyclophilin family peptidyl-prolyl cis-trans isomerase